MRMDTLIMTKRIMLVATVNCHQQECHICHTYKCCLSTYHSTIRREFIARSVSDKALYTNYKENMSSRLVVDITLNQR